MRTNFLKSISIILIVCCGFLSCNDNNDPVVAGPPPPPGLPELLYREGGAPSLTAVSNPSANGTSREIFGRNGTTKL